MKSLQPRKAPQRHWPRPPSFSPWPCTTLSVDPGENCGACVMRSGKYVDSGHGDGYDTRWVERYIDAALFFANAVNQPLVLVLEQPPGGGAAYGGRNLLGAASMIGCRKLWLHAWMRTEGVAKKARVSVYPQSWRSPLFGTSRGTLPQELVLASRTKYGNVSAAIDPDEAAAICIGTWATFAAQVGAVLPKPRGRR